MKLILSMLISFSTFASIAALPESYLIVANRSDSSISLVDSVTTQVVKTIDAQSLGFEFEPMYASHLSSAKVFAVGDRKNNKILFFDDVSAQLLATIAVSKGVFHQWAKPGDNTLVVATDGIPGADLIKITRNKQNLIDIETSRFDVGGEHSGVVPHDVVIDDQYFYLSAHATDKKGKDFDKVLKVDRKSLKVVDFKKFEPDVHLGLPQESPYLIVAEQSGTINFITRSNMEIVKTVKNLPGAHGLFWNPKGTLVYSANIASDGPASLYVIDNQYFGSANLVSTKDSGFDKPHNLVADFDSGLLFLTHSGANDKVSVYDMNNSNKLLKTITTGANPFGIGIVKK